MTDDAPSPTTRMPVPEPPADSPTQGWPGATAPESDAAADVGSWSTPPADPPIPPVPPVPPVHPVASALRRDDRDHGRTASVLFGLVILGVGAWFFVERTLGYDLPDVRWSQLWPAVLIGIGLWVVLGSIRRGSR